MQNEHFTNCKICGNSIATINETLKLSQCQTCNFIFYNQRINEEEIDKIYSELYSENGEYYRIFNTSKINIEQGKQPDLGYVRNSIIRRALSKIKNNKDVGEIGASVGSVGFALQKKGYNYTGFELHKPTVEFAQKNGINVKEGGFHALENYKNKFDVVFAFEVIEHIEDLKLCLTFLNQSLKKGGYFAFSVPNYAKIKDNPAVKDKIYQMPPPVHINFFTDDSIKKMFPLFNFKVIDLRKKWFLGPSELKLRNQKRFLRWILGKYEGPSLMVLVQKN